jgi:hypothetical protein
MTNDSSTLGWQMHCLPFPSAAVQLPHQRGFIDSAKLNNRQTLLFQRLHDARQHRLGVAEQHQRVVGKE